MSRPEGAADRVAPAGTAGQAQRADSLAEHAEVGKQAAPTRLGEILAAMPKNKGVLKRGPVVPDENHGDDPPTLADLATDKKVRL